jgi:hypothetical protein
VNFSRVGIFVKIAILPCRGSNLRIKDMGGELQPIGGILGFGKVKQVCHLGNYQTAITFSRNDSDYDNF